MSFGPRFKNLLEEIGTTEVLPDLFAKLTECLSLPAGPWTLYLSRTASLSESIVLPRRFSVVFGPGATLLLGRSEADLNPVTLEIQGEVDLGIERRFVTVRSESRVILSGPLDAVRPEWFRSSRPVPGSAASPVSEVSDDVALREALRCLRDRVERGAPSVPIRLQGNYLLREAMVIPAAEAEYVFEGRFPKGDGGLPATFQRHPASTSDHALWIVRPGARVRATLVGFDARGDAELPRGPDIAAVIHQGYVDGSRFDHCTFFVDRGIGVWCEAREDAQRPVGDQGLPERITFLNCWFQMEPIGAPGVGIHLAEAGAARLRVDGCSFRGDAAAMVEVVSGMLDVTACDFHNEPWAAFRAGEFYGVDLRVGLVARSRAEVARGRPLAPLMVNVVHVQTRSPRHFEGVRQNAPGDSVVSFTGLVARRKRLTATDSLPVIRWVGVRGDQFLLQGSDVSGPVIGPVDERGNLETVLATRSRP